MNLLKQYSGLKKEVYVIALCKMIDMLGSLVGPMFTLILSLKLGFSAEKIALWMLVFSFIQMPVNLIGGKLADKVNKKLLINICDFSSSFIYILCGFLNIQESTIILYLFGSLLQTLERAAYDILLADSTTSNDRDRAYSLGYLATNFGLILAPIIGGYLLKDYCNLLFLIAGSTQFISLIIFDFNIKESKLTMDENNIYEQASKRESIVGIFLDNKVVFIFVLIQALSVAAYMQWNYILPLDMAKVYGENGSIFFGHLNSLNCIVVFVLTSFITSLISKIDSLRKMSLASFLELIAYVLFAFCIHQLWVLYFSIIVFTIGEIVATISSSPYLLNRVPGNYRGRVFAFQDACNSLVSGLFTLIVGKLYDNYGSFQAWLLVMGLLILVVLSFLLLRFKDKKDYKNLYNEN